MAMLWQRVCVLVLFVPLALALCPYDDRIFDIPHATPACSAEDKTLLRAAWATLTAILNNPSHMLDPNDNTPRAGAAAVDNAPATGKVLARALFGAKNADKARDCFNAIAAIGTKPVNDKTARRKPNPKSPICKVAKFQLYCSNAALLNFVKEMTGESVGLWNRFFSTTQDGGSEKGWTTIGHYPHGTSFLLEDNFAQFAKLTKRMKIKAATPERMAHLHAALQDVQRHLSAKSMVDAAAIRALHGKDGLLSATVKTLYHELVHAVCQKRDEKVVLKKGGWISKRKDGKAYGLDRALQLAEQDADLALNNADNHALYLIEGTLLASEKDYLPRQLLENDIDPKLVPSVLDGTLDLEAAVKATAGKSLTDSTKRVLELIESFRDDEEPSGL